MPTARQEGHLIHDTCARHTLLRMRHITRTGTVLQPNPDVQGNISRRVVEPMRDVMFHTGSSRTVPAIITKLPHLEHDDVR